jgi:hypothetical protein
MRTYNKRKGIPGTHSVAGAATSASKVNRRVGLAINSHIAWYERGRPVKWATVINSVARAFRRWQHKMEVRRMLHGDGGNGRAHA